jgi:hypothetical protein
MEGTNLRDQQMIMRMEALVEEANERAIALQLQINAAEQVLETDPNPISIVNLIDNSDFDWSNDRFLNNPTLGGDIDFEAFNWFRQTKATTLLVEDAAHALKFTGHSLYAANEGADADIPRWERPNGWAEIGEAGATGYDLACPLPENFVKPGRGRLFVQFQASRRTATALPAGIQVYGGFYDNTAGQEKYIEGGNFTLTAAVVGATGSTSRQFKIIGTSDYGTQIESNVVTIANAPATLTPSNYIRLNMAGATGFIQFDIYELVGGVCSRIWQIFNSNDVSFNHTDSAPKVNVGGAFPTATLSKPRAYVETDEFFVSDGAWTLFDLQIPIPSTYDTSVTTGKVWFRWGLTLPTTDARQVLLDRLGISFGFGHWAPSARRPANNVSSTSMASSDQNPPSGGGGPPGDGEGGPRCWVLEGCKIPAMHGEKESVLGFEELQIGTRLVSDALRPNTMVSKRRHVVDSNEDAQPTDRVFVIETANGLSHQFTGTHRLRRNADDVRGTPLMKLKTGDTLITRPKIPAELTTITRLELLRGRFEVGAIALGPGHWLWVNGFASHNLKINQF